MLYFGKIWPSVYPFRLRIGCSKLNGKLLKHHVMVLLNNEKVWFKYCYCWLNIDANVLPNNKVSCKP